MAKKERFDIVKELVSIDFSKIEGKSGDVVVQSEPTWFDYDGTSGFRLTLMVLNSSSPLYLQHFTVRKYTDDKSEMPAYDVGDPVVVEYDKQESSIYARTSQNSSYASVELSLKIKGIEDYVAPGQ